MDIILTLIGVVALAALIVFLYNRKLAEDRLWNIKYHLSNKITQDKMYKDYQEKHKTPIYGSDGELVGFNRPTPPVWPKVRTS